jgi:hypothetical protein
MSSNHSKETSVAFYPRETREWKLPLVVIEVINDIPVVDHPCFADADEASSFDKWVFEQNPTWTKFGRACGGKEFPQGFPRPASRHRYYALIEKIGDRQRNVFILSRPSHAKTWDSCEVVGIMIDLDAKHAMSSEGVLV